MADANAPPAPPHEQQQGLKNVEGLSGDDILRATRPKHIGDGIGSGLGAMATGVVAGIAGLVVAPVRGAQKGGFTGFAGGLAAGVVGAVVLPVAGIAGGAVQIGRGVVNTPEAIHGKYTGKVWNPDTAEWEEPKELPSTAIQVYQGKSGPGTTGPSDHTAEDLYAILGVDKTASPEEIKKKYYLLARKYHPDKNPGNDEATAIFQAVGRAFQILGNPETRQKYDRGELDATGKESMDAGILFGMLFGSEKFDALVGEMMAVTMAKHGEKRPPQSELRKVQQERVLRLAGNLSAVLDTFDPAAPEAFKKARQEQADLLAKEPFGETLLAVIGEIYVREAARHQANFLKSGLLKWEGKKASMNANMAQVKSVFAMAKHAQKAEEIAKEMEAKVMANPDDEEVVFESLKKKEEMEKETMVFMLQFMWAVNDVDIRQTLKTVIAMVLREEKGAPEKAKNRALGLLEMGTIFTEVCGPQELRSKSANFQAALQRMDDLQRGAAPA